MVAPRTCSRLLLSLALLLVPVTAAAQRTDALPEGARVRFHTDPPPQRFSGALLAPAGDTLHFRRCASCLPSAVAVADVTALQRSTGRYRSWRRGAVGGLGGALVGMLVGMGMAKMAEPSECTSFCGLDIVAGGIAGMLVGAPVGAAIGFRKSDVWENVPKR